jgi:hypothetical protein
LGSTAIDVARDSQKRFSVIGSAIAAAFLVYDPRRNEIRVTTLLEVDDTEVEAKLAQIELDLEEAFQGHFSLDFATIHLRGRDPKAFIPADAFIIHRSAHLGADVK